MDGAHGGFVSAGPVPAGQRWECGSCWGGARLAEGTTEQGCCQHPAAFWVLSADSSSLVLPDGQLHAPRECRQRRQDPVGMTVCQPVPFIYL